MSTNDPNSPGQSSYNYGQQQPWTGPPTNPPSSGGAILIIVMALGVMIILVVGCLGAAVGLFWFRASEMRDMEMTQQMERDRAMAEQMAAMEAAQRAQAATQGEPPPPMGAGEREQWTYERGPEGFSGTINKQEDGSWLENRSDGVEFHFQERARDPEFIELFDETRNLEVRIGNDHLEWRRNGQPWCRGQGGAWTSSSATSAE